MSIPNKGMASQLAFPSAELVFGFVYHVGTDISGVQLALENYICRFGYVPKQRRLSESIKQIFQRIPVKDINLNESCEAARIDSYMTAGNRLCEAAKDEAFIVAAVIAEINGQRTLSKPLDLKEPLPKTAHILLSLKRPEEVSLLKSIYGDGFFLIGVFASEKDRAHYLTNDKNIPIRKALALMKRDEDENEPFGQRSRKTFELADVFIQLNSDEYKQQLERFLDLVFGDPFITPNSDEHAMFLAYSAALRSGQLARQVGAAIRSKSGDIIAVGCNDVPAAGGGLYWPNKTWNSEWRPAQEYDKRDHVKGYDSNDFEQREIVKDLIKRLKLNTSLEATIAVLEESRLMDITEYGRAVHAEMDALITCARNGISPIGASLFTTTFPCHNCTRHIIAAGVERVVYVEPYPKSMATKLHKDSIELCGNQVPKFAAGKDRHKVPFEPFVGIGPRRFFDLFSMKMSAGYPVKRKDKEGSIVRWRRDGCSPRVQMLPTSYTQRESLTADSFLSTVQKLEEERHGIQRLDFEDQQQ